MSLVYLERLAALQRQDGCFASVVTAPAGERLDHNGFVTASVLRLLRRVPDVGALGELRKRCLDFVETCAAVDPPGAYAFWPERLRPDWAMRVPADVDDTALMLGELARHGRLDRAAALRALCTVIVPCRVRPADTAVLPPWVLPGSFHTWIAHDRAAQVVDCCVNANVAALMAQLGAAHLPGYSEAVRTVVRGLAWAGDDRARLASLTPFYPSLRSLADAVQHAVECGVRELDAASLELDRLAAAIQDEGAGCCSSAYGHAVWRCAALEEARAMARAWAD